MSLRAAHKKIFGFSRSELVLIWIRLKLSVVLDKLMRRPQKKPD